MMNEAQIRKLHLTIAGICALTEHPEPGIITYRETLNQEIDHLLNLLQELKHPRVLPAA